MATAKKRATSPKKKALVPRPAYDPEQRVVAVTGAYSFIGAELIKKLERDYRYYKVLAIDIRKPTLPMVKTQFHKVDLTLPTADAELAAGWQREGVDPLMQLLHERDVVDAFVHAVDFDCPGEFNIVGDGVLPYSTLLAMMGRIPVAVPHFVARSLSGALWATQVFDMPPYFLDFLRFL